MTLRTRVGAGVAVMAMAVLPAGCAQQVNAGTPVADVAAQGYVAGDGSTTIVARAERRAAPELSGTTLDGEDFSLVAHRGDLVVINVWASWCAPCRSEAPDLQAVNQEVADRGVTFVGLNTRDSDAAARAFADRFALSYPSVVDADGSRQLLFHKTLPPSAIPSTLVIDRDGRVAARAIGEVDRSRLLGLIEPILAEGGSAVPTTGAGEPS